MMLRLVAILTQFEPGAAILSSLCFERKPHSSFFAGLRMKLFQTALPFGAKPTGVSS